MLRMSEFVLKFSFIGPISFSSDLTKLSSAPDTNCCVWLIFQAVLAAIIFVNLHSMMKQFLDIPALWKTNKIDMVSVPKCWQGRFSIPFFWQNVGTFLLFILHVTSFSNTFLLQTCFFTILMYKLIH